MEIEDRKMQRKKTEEFLNVCIVEDKKESRKGKQNMYRKTIQTRKY